MPRSLLLLWGLLLTFLGCAPEAGQEPAAQKQATAAGVATPVVRADSKDLLFTFMGPQGELRTAASIDAVPKEVRSRVLVVDLSKSPKERQAHRYAFFVDLTTPKPDGTYPVTTVSRYNAAVGGSAAALAPTPAGAVVVYSAQWCGFCKKAKRYLRAQNVPFIERDVEKTPGAQRELSEKLRKAKLPSSGIPVIDVAGELIVGFDKPKLAAALQRLRAGSKPP